MFGKILLAGAGVLTGAALSEGTKGKAKAAAREARDTARSAWKDLGDATTDARAAASRGWDRTRRFWYEKVLEEPVPRRPDPPASAPPS